MKAASSSQHIFGRPSDMPTGTSGVDLMPSSAVRIERLEAPPAWRAEPRGTRSVRSRLKGNDAQRARTNARGQHGPVAVLLYWLFR